MLSNYASLPSPAGGGDNFLKSMEIEDVLNFLPTSFLCSENALEGKRDESAEDD